MVQLRDSLVTLACTAISACVAPFVRPPQRPLPENPRILVLKPCCLGDLLLATPALAALRKRYPTAAITLGTSDWSRPAVEGNPHIDRIFTWEVPDAGGLSALTHYRNIAGKLRQQRFDIAVVLDRSPVVAMVAWFAGIPVRAGIDSGGRGFSLTHRVSAGPLRHEADLYYDVVRTLTGEREPLPLLFQPSPEEQAWAKSALPAGDWVAVHPGGGVNPGSSLLGKRWPAERFGELAGRLLSEGRSVLLVGGPQDVAAATAVQERATVLAGEANAGRLRNLAGATSFGQMGALLEHCRAFIGNDTGAMHLAVATGTPTVAIFGPSKPLVYRPYSSTNKVIYHGEQCSGCVFRGGLAIDCKHAYACTAAVTVDEVWQALQELLVKPARI